MERMERMERMRRMSRMRRMDKVIDKEDEQASMGRERHTEE